MREGFFSVVFYLGLKTEACKTTIFWRLFNWKFDIEDKIANIIASNFRDTIYIMCIQSSSAKATFIVLLEYLKKQICSDSDFEIFFLYTGM